MNSNFENKCTYTYKYYLELKRKTLAKGFKNAAYGLLLIGFALLLFSAWKKMPILSITAVVFMAFVVYRLVATPIQLARFSAMKNRQVHEQDVKTLNVFYDEYIEATNLLTKGATKIKYEEVRRVLSTKSLYIIEMEEGLVLMIDRNGFTKGTENDFRSFISEKCVNAEVKI